MDYLAKIRVEQEKAENMYYKHIGYSIDLIEEQIKINEKERINIKRKNDGEYKILNGLEIRLIENTNKYLKNHIEIEKLNLDYGSKSDLWIKGFFIITGLIFLFLYPSFAGLIPSPKSEFWGITIFIITIICLFLCLGGWGVLYEYTIKKINKPVNIRKNNSDFKKELIKITDEHKDAIIENI